MLLRDDITDHSVAILEADVKPPHGSEDSNETLYGVVVHDYFVSQAFFLTVSVLTYDPGRRILRTTNNMLIILLNYVE